MVSQGRTVPNLMGNGWTGVLSSQALGPDLLPNMRISPNLTQPVPPRRHAMSSFKSHNLAFSVCESLEGRYVKLEAGCSFQFDCQ